MPLERHKLIFLHGMGWIPHLLFYKYDFDAKQPTKIDKEKESIGTISLLIT